MGKVNAKYLLPSRLSCEDEERFHLHFDTDYGFAKCTLQPQLESLQQVWALLA
jgi:hypothetical protein